MGFIISVRLKVAKWITASALLAPWMVFVSFVCLGRGDLGLPRRAPDPHGLQRAVGLRKRVRREHRGRFRRVPQDRRAGAGGGVQITIPAKQNLGKSVHCQPPP